MNVRVSIGLTAYSAEKKERLLQMVRSRVPDQKLYDGHPFTSCFHLDGEYMFMEKRPDGNVELVLITDHPEPLFPI